HGSGHGVGMCVIGSARLAERGVSAEAILARYYPGLKISASTAIGVAAGSQPGRSEVAAGSDRGRSRVAAGSQPGRNQVATSSESGLTLGSAAVLVTLPDEDEGARDAIVRQTLRARDDLATAI